MYMSMEVSLWITPYGKQILKPIPEQMSTMGGFPTGDYHYIIHTLPFQHYHGVEHHNSTVICFGPWQELSQRSSYKSF